MSTRFARFGGLFSLRSRRTAVVAAAIAATGGAGSLAFGCAASGGAPTDGEAGISSRVDASLEEAGYDAGYGYSDDADPGDAGAGEGSAHDASGEGGPKVDAGPNLCVSPNDCATNARDIGSVSGDTSPSTNSVTATGTTSEWVKFRVTEDYNNLFSGRQLKVKAELASPTGANYDIHLYVNHGADQLECSTVTVESNEPTGQIDQVIDNWGEGSLPNGSSDSRDVSVYVENISGPCGNGHEWSLTITGNP